MAIREEIPVASEAPWLILSNDSYFKPEYSLTGTCFRSLSEERIYRIELPLEKFGGIGADRRWCCCGSSSGWLLMAGVRNLHSTEMFLWNPISRATRKLPAISTLPFFNRLVDNGIRFGIENVSCFIPRVQVFSVGSAECVVAVLFRNLAQGPNKRQELALCTPLDTSWSICGAGGKQHIYRDIVFHNGKLCASCIEDTVANTNTIDDVGTVIRKANYTVHLSGCDVEVDELQLMYEDVATGDNQRLDSASISFCEKVQRAEHLVESSKGELLAVSAIQDLCTHFSWGNEDPIASFTRTQTREFEVWRQVGDCLEKLNGIGEQGIFVGATGSSSLLSSYNGVEADQIYFAIDDAGGIGRLEEDTDVEYEDEVVDAVENRVEEEVLHLVDEEEDNEENDECDNPDSLYVVREQGVYNVQEKKIQTTSSTNLRVRTGSVTGWFTPKLFQR